MEIAPARGASDQEGLCAALAGLDAAELCEVGKRLVRSHEGLEQALEDLQAERKELEDENAQVHATITLVMQDLNKLNIGASNIAEPQLEEGPVEFIGRLWERVKPRDTAVSISEHVGEIKKPVASMDESPRVLLGKQVAERGQELKRQLSDQFSIFKSAINQAAGGMPPTGMTPTTEVGQRLYGAFGLLSQAGDTPAAASPEPASSACPKAEGPERRPSVGQLFSYFSTPGMMPQVGPDSSGPGVDDDALEPKLASAKSEDLKANDADAGNEHTEVTSSASTGTDSGVSSKVVSKECVSREGSDDIVADAVLEAPSCNHSSRIGDISAPALSGTAADIVAIDPVEPAQPSQEQSSLLIQVQLTLGDGGVVELKVHAADRCKEVAARFVQENSLKKVFEAPLKAYLMEVEANADKFPVQLAADIMDIRNRYSSKK